ncbi:macro domain-containing protein [uncultured Streptococcus sp.]|uniref:macro domain-containing protein n=1 Tax=uncultured Streptococcus sp. TaxID=83427 RepID=UPI0025F65478|nr:macro domain-containing protein [uncultured Streptococcus sp.]
MIKKSFKLSYKYFFSFLSLLSLLATFINISDIYESNNIISHIFKVIITFLVLYVLSFAYALLNCYFKRRVIYFKYNKFEVSGTYGNILDYIGASKVNLIVPVNSCFDTKIDDSVISTNSLHGKVIKFLYDNNLVSQTELDKKIKRSLREQNISSVNIGNDVKKGGKSVGNYNRYPIGSTAFVDIGDVRYHFIALSIIENNKNAITSDQDYLIVLNAIVDNCFRNSNGNPIYLPLVGSGLSKLNYNHQQQLEFMVKYFMLRRTKLISDVEIVIRKEDRDKISIL